jgi:uncharacterized membrane protein HdeD (DUF308 family)
MELSNNDLRAIAGLILLILGIALLFLKDETDIVNYVVIGLASFLIGGNILTKSDQTKNNGD